MQRKFFRGFLICFLPCLLAGFYAIFGQYKLGIDLAGGTILVYEVNLERTKQRKDVDSGPRPAQSKGPAAGLTNDEMQQLAAQIKRRIDPADLKNVTVRPLGDNRVEIVLPTGGAGAKGKENLNVAEIADVKQLISQMGVLEFRILANENDDSEGIKAAQNLIDNSGSQAALDALAEKGLPPDGPAEEFDVKIGDTDAKVRYVWVEIGKEERENMGLDNASESKLDERGELWRLLSRNRNKTYIHKFRAEGKEYTKVFYSRDCKSKEKDEKKYEYYLLTRVSPLDNVKLTGDITLTANSETDPKNGNPAVGFRFNGPGSQQFGRVTERNKPTQSVFRSLAIVLDEKIVSAPTINNVIRGTGQITGGFTKTKVDQLVKLLRSGALSAELRDRPVSENMIGPTLGADTIKRGTLSIGIAFGVVLVFMLIYYRFAGVVACIALLANLLLTVGFMVAMNAAFTLPGLAGIVLMLGMAVDANVLIYERLREERNKGANLVTSIRNGYDHAFPTIIDTHLTSIFTAIVLYTFGNDNLKGFAISLTVGLIISLFTSLYMTRLMFDFWLHKRWLTEMRMLRLFERPTFNPMKYRYYLFTLTSVLTVLGLGLFLFRGENLLNVDFRGGTVYEGILKDGEERALTTTSDGKLGLRDLLDKENQDKKLNATKADWVNKLQGDSAAANTFIYVITYDDGSKATVTLTQQPSGTTDEERAKEVLARASHLPDVSIEQIFHLGENYPDAKSRRFAVRTTEKQRDLVQVSLDRLFRDASGKAIISGAVMSYKQPIDGPVVELSFDKPISPAYIKDLLDREFRKSGAEDAATAFSLAGVGTADEGRFKSFTLDVSKSTNFDRLRPGAATGPERDAQLQTLREVVKDTAQSFNTFPEPERLEVFDSQLASDTRTKAFLAILYSWLAIMLYLWFRFGSWTFGAAAVLCLIHDLCFTLGAIAVCHYVYDFPGIGFLLGLQDFKIDLSTVAALLTLVGYSVSDTIVVFDRIREVRGKNPALTPQMINDSVNQTLSRTILAATTVFLVGAVLFFFGGDGVHLFAFVMVMGVLVGTYSSIFVASPLLLIFGEGHGSESTEAPKQLAEAAVVEA